MRSRLLLFCFVLTWMASSWTAVRAETLVYLGTYTRGSSQGIYVSHLDTATGALSDPILAATAENPSFVAIHPKQPLLYAVSEISGDEDTIGVMAFRINSDGTLEKLNERPTGGDAACHVSVDPTGRCVGVANYTGGSCITFPIAADGSLGDGGTFIQHTGGSGANPRRQNAPHGHAFNFNADGTQAFVNDLGKDQILIYDVDPKTAKMTPAKQPFLSLPAGGGPRHFCFDPSYRVAAANLEMTSQVALLAYDAKQKTLEALTIRDSLPKGEKRQGNSTAECLVHPNGQFVYVSNRGHNSLAAYRLDVDKQTLTPIGNTPSGGAIPRGFGIDPSGQFLIAGNQKSGNVVSFKIDTATGNLEPTGHSIQVDSAVNVRFFER